MQKRLRPRFSPLRILGALAFAWRRFRMHRRMLAAGSRAATLRYEGLRFRLYHNLGRKGFAARVRSGEGELFFSAGEGAPNVESLQRSAVEGLHANRPTLVLLHGFLDSSHTFRRLLPELNKRFDVFVCDVPGFGASFAPEARELWKIPSMARALARVLFMKLGLRNVALVTHSMGGVIALHMLRYLEHLEERGLARLSARESIRELHLLAPGLWRMPSEERETMRKMLFPRSRSEVRDLVARFYVRRSPDLSEFIVQALLDEWSQIGYYYLAENTIEDEDQVFFEPADLRKLQTPLTVYWAEDEALLPEWHAHRFAKRGSGAELVRIPQAGHALHLENPEAALQELLARIGAGRSAGAHPGEPGAARAEGRKPPGNRARPAANPHRKRRRN